MCDEESRLPRSPGGIAHGARLGGDGSRPGMIFYNDEETENGGFVFEGRSDSSGHHAGAQLSLDQYDQDQVLTLVYDDERGKRTTGLNVFDRPDVAMVPWFAARDSISRLPDGPAKVEARQQLFGQLGGKPMTAPRVSVGRDSLGNARIEFLDPRGRVTQQFIPSGDTLRPPK